MHSQLEGVVPLRSDANLGLVAHPAAHATLIKLKIYFKTAFPTLIIHVTVSEYGDKGTV